MIWKSSFWLFLGILAFGLSFPAFAVQSEVARCEALMADEDDLRRGAPPFGPQQITDPEFLKEAVHVCEQALSNDPDNPKLLFQVGLALTAREIVNGEEITGRNYMTRAAEAGYVTAQVYLAKLHAAGVFGEADTEKALYWYERAAKNGDQESQANYGYWIVSGQGMPKNPEKGIAYLEDLADQGNMYAHTGLGSLFYLGGPVPKDRDRAMHHLEIAAAHEQPKAMLLLGMHLYEVHLDEIWAGYEKSENIMRALGLLEKAAERGEGLAGVVLGQFYDVQAEMRETKHDAEAAAEMRALQLHWLCKSGAAGREFIEHEYPEAKEDPCK